MVMMLSEPKYRAYLYKNVPIEFKLQTHKLGVCPLCGRDHSKDPYYTVELTCPYCKSLNTWKVKPHSPGGYSRGETRICKQCGKEVFIIIYYDGEVCVRRQ